MFYNECLSISAHRIMWTSTNMMLEREVRGRSVVLYLLGIANIHNTYHNIPYIYYILEFFIRIYIIYSSTRVYTQYFPRWFGSCRRHPVLVTAGSGPVRYFKGPSTDTTCGKPHQEKRSNEKTSIGTTRGVPLRMLECHGLYHCIILTL